MFNQQGPSPGMPQSDEFQRMKDEITKLKADQSKTKHKLKMETE